MGDGMIALDDVDPNATVLEWLRYDARRTGTKEGCAEGDCGACSVVVGELDGNSIRYRAVNACIQFLPTLDGKHLITVEDLGDDDALHPVQQALVDKHGSQCGFCTPGFVMALFALYHENRTPDRAAINDAIAGNLCRCTGYRPIVDAALEMGRNRQADRFRRAEADTVKRLKKIRRKDTLAIESHGRRYFAPRTVEALADLFSAYPDAILLAGGTDVGLWVTKQHRDLDTLIYTGAVEPLREIAVSENVISIGSAATYTDAFGTLAEDWPDFGEVLRRLGSVQIRNAGTIGGNIGNASPIGDSMPLLIALGAMIVLRRGGKTREMPLEDFFVDYRKTRLRRGEFITAIRVPRPGPADVFRAYKISKRFDQDISAVCAAINLETNGDQVRVARIAFGGMAATPKRAKAAESAMVGRPWTITTVQGAMAALGSDFAPIDDMRASGAYRLQVARNLLYKAYLETSGSAEETRVLAFGT